MKQTNNALTFLMAQYRAIFKNAYFKGLTSALVLTTGLAQVTQAEGATDFNPSTTPFSGDIILTTAANNSNAGKFKVGETEYSITSSKGVTISGEQNDLSINFAKVEGNDTFKFNDVSFNIATDDHAGFGARVGFGEGTYNFTGNNNNFTQMLTIDAGNKNNAGNKSIKFTGGGTLNVTGYLTISMGAGDNQADFSGVDVHIKSG